MEHDASFEPGAETHTHTDPTFVIRRFFLYLSSSVMNSIFEKKKRSGSFMERDERFFVSSTNFISLFPSVDGRHFYNLS